MPELILILVIALIVVGPDKLPELAKALGRAIGEFRRATEDIKETIDLESIAEEESPTLSQHPKDKGSENSTSEKDTKKVGK